MEVRIEPLDTLFFRDGKPFSMGEETWADGYLLPPPSVIYGALRTAIATQNGIALEEINSRLNEENLHIRSIYLRMGGQIALPLPMDLVESKEKASNIKKAEKEAKKYAVTRLSLIPASGLVFPASKSKVKYLVESRQYAQVDSIEHGAILTTELEKYLAGNFEQTEALKLTDYIREEPKVGIGRDDLTRFAEEGNLYRVDMKRFEDLQIGVSYECEKYENISSLVLLGGERKLAAIALNRKPFHFPQTTIDFSSGRFLIYFATLAIFSNGEPTLSELGVSATLVAAYVGKPAHVGGYDIQKKEAKPMYRAVPAGSVFYYEAQGDISSLNDKQGIQLSDKQNNQGFGIAYFGTWNEQ